ncbi:sraP, partial [Ophiophagus hannah]
MSIYNKCPSCETLLLQPKKTFQKVKEQPEDSEEFKQDKGNTATSVKKDVPSKVKPKDRQPDEESPSQTDSLVSPEAVAEEESPSGITKIPLHIQNEDIVLQLQDKLKDCEATEDLLSQTISILSPGVSIEDKTSSCSTEVFQNIEEKDSILRLFSFRLPVDDAATSVAEIADLRSRAELSPSESFVRSQNQLVREAKDTTLLLDLGKALYSEGEEQRQPAWLPQSWNSRSNKASAGASTGTVYYWQQASQSAQDSSHGFSTTAVEIPFLSENANDDQCERREEIELTKTSAKQNDTDDSQAYVAAPALDSSSLTSTLNDIPRESVLVREKDNELTEISAKHQNDTDDSQAYVVAPALGSSSLPSTVNDIPFEPVVVREKDTGLTEISPKHQNDTDDSQAYVVAPALGSSSLPSTVNDIPFEPVLVREKDTGLTETAKQQNDTDDSQAYVVAPALDYSNLPSTLNDIPCEPVLLREKDTGLTETSAKQNDTDDSQAYVVAPALDSSSPSSTLNDIPFEVVLVREKDTGLVFTSISSNGNHNIESLVKSKSSSPKINHSINSKHSSTNQTSRDLCCQSPKSYVRQECSSRSSGKRELSTERQDRKMGNVYGMPYHLSPERSIVNKKEIRESRQVVEPKIPVIEKKKRATLRTGRKPLKSSTKKEKTSSPCHLNAEEETNSSVPSWTPKDRSAAVLARKEELEQAYLQVLLNFGVIAIMLVEKEPCMIEAMSSALRANLRKIGDYYECLLKNYIDSLTEAN